MRVDLPSQDRLLSDSMKDFHTQLWQQQDQAVSRCKDVLLTLKQARRELIQMKQTCGDSEIFPSAPEAFTVISVSCWFHIKVLTA